MKNKTPSMNGSRIDETVNQTTITEHQTAGLHSMNDRRGTIL